MNRPTAFILCSGRGSNFEAIARAVAENRLKLDILAVCSDRENAPVLERATQRGIVTHVLTGDKVQREDRLLQLATQLKPRFLILAGFMRILSPRVIDAFRNDSGYSRVTNVHPSLLPMFKGVGGYAQAWEKKVKVTGVTVHLVEPELDSGPILAQESFSMEGCQSVDEVEAKGLAIEHRLYPETLSWVLTEKFRIEGGKCFRE